MEQTRNPVGEDEVDESQEETEEDHPKKFQNKRKRKKAPEDLEGEEVTEKTKKKKKKKRHSEKALEGANEELTDDFEKRKKSKKNKSLEAVQEEDDGEDTERPRKKKKSRSVNLEEVKALEQEVVHKRKRKKKRKRHSEEIFENNAEEQMENFKKCKKSKKRKSPEAVQEEEGNGADIERSKKKKKKRSVNSEEVEAPEQEIVDERKRKKKKKKKIISDNEFEPLTEQMVEPELSKKKKKKNKKSENDTSIAPRSPVLLKHFLPTPVNRALQEIYSSGRTEKSPEPESRESSDSDDDFVLDPLPKGIEGRIKSSKGRGKVEGKSVKTSLQLLDEGIFKAMNKIETTDSLGAEDVAWTGEDADPRFLMRHVYPLPRLHKTADRLMYTVISWILKYDFSLPKLNRTKEKVLWHLSKKEIKEILEKFPRFQSMRFTEAEDIVILKRLQVLMKEVRLSPDDVIRILKEMAYYNRTDNKCFSKVILGAYLGRPMLEYRRAIDSYIRLKHMLRLGDGTIDKKATHRKEKRFNCKLKTGQFSDDDISSLMYIVLKQAGTCRVTQISKKKIRWTEIAEEMLRNTKSVMKVWEERIYPTLARHISGEDLDDQDWQQSLLELILKDESITMRKQIQWAKMQDAFPFQTGYSMQRVLNTYVKGAVGTDKEGAGSFREAVQKGLGRLRERNPKQNKAVRKIIAEYEGLKAKLEGFSECGERTKAQ